SPSSPRRCGRNDERCAPPVEPTSQLSASVLERLDRKVTHILRLETHRHERVSVSRLIAIFGLPILAVTAWLLWRSLDWPLTGAAAIFYFMSNQFLIGLVPYCDLADINMPLIYGIHAAIIALAGMGDVAWRAFDLLAAATMSALILGLMRPAGWPAAILAML